MSSVDTYRQRAAAHTAQHDAAARVSTGLSRWRLITFLPALGLLIWSGSGAGIPALLGAFALFLAFGVLVVRHARVDERVAWFSALRTVNERAIARIERRWDGLPTGNAPAGISTDGHPYAVDLDLFGRASLFQFLGPAATPNGAETLARWLLAAASPQAVQCRQAAVAELGPLDDWREQLGAFGIIAEAGHPLPISGFLEWAESPATPLPYFNLLRGAVYGLTAAIWLLIVLQLAGVTHGALWPIPLLAGMILSFLTAYPVTPAFHAAGSGQNALKRYAALFAHVVSRPFQAPTLVSLQQRLASDTEPAPAAMRRLNRILGFSELRSGSALLHFPIQALTLWDFHVLFALERWRRTTGTHVRDWMQATGEIDALSRFAEIHHDNPDWCWPQLAPGVVDARALGHPLIRDDRRVSNDVTVGPAGTVLLVTGSNMSGKSTLLRAIGLNTVLAQAGAPACAGEMSLPSCELQSSIRIQDSLERGISYFMAALSRLKGVVDAAERRSDARTLLYLLDEILQGTNSAERGIAVQAVARHLLDAGAIGVMTTHDLSLADEEPLHSTAVLVHFTEIVDEDGSMRFDYKLRPGIATSRNALRLMRYIGIQ